MLVLKVLNLELRLDSKLNQAIENNLNSFILLNVMDEWKKIYLGMIILVSLCTSTFFIPHKGKNLFERIAHCRRPLDMQERIFTSISKGFSLRDLAKEYGLNENSKAYRKFSRETIQTNFPDISLNGDFHNTNRLTYLVPTYESIENIKL